MIRVVEAISDSNIGGAGILLLNRLKHSDRTLFDTTVLLPKGSQLADRFRRIGISVKEVVTEGDISFSVKGVFAYYHALKRITPDIINSHGNLNSRIAAWLLKTPVKIYTRHCVYPVGHPYKFSLIRRGFGVFTNMISDHIIAVAYSAKKNLMEMGAEANKICVIINGAEPLRIISAPEKDKVRASLNIDKGDIVVTICARLEACKDHRCFLQAARILTSQSPKYKFLILGSGGMEKELKAYSHRLGLDSAVRFLGFAEDTAPYMNITDINVNCSVGTETSSLALSEGMSIGLPAVVSDYGGNPYMVRNGENGYVYKAGDSIALTRAIKRVIKNREEYRILSQAARRRYLQELNAKAMTEKTEKLYSELYKRKKPKR